MSNHLPNPNSSLVSRMYECLLFFLHFVRHPIRVGAPFPCVRGITRMVTKELTAAGSRRVVELGSGLGSLTAGILAALEPQEKLLCVERNTEFCRRLKKRFGERIEVLQGDALHLKDILAHTPWEKPDAVVCSVPLANRSAMPLCRTIAEVLYPDGLYLQVANFPKPVEAYFDIQKTYHFFKNIPPERLHRAFPKNGNRPR